MKDLLIKKEATSLWKDKKVAIAIVAVMTIPILYAGMFLWAFWDPYDYLESLPIAIINEDEGTVYEGEELDLGNELITKLKEEDLFDFHFVDEQTGYTGLQNEEYYVVIEIPHNFSAHATTLLDDTPEKMDLLYVPNESFNFLAAQMGETAMLEIESALEEKVIETYADTLFDSVDQLADGFVTARDGSSELFDGTVKLSDGVNELQDGSITLADGTLQLYDHLGILADRSTDLSSGLQEASTGAETLTTGIADMDNGLAELLDGQVTLVEGATALEDGTSDIATNLADVNQGLTDVSTGMGAVIDGTGALGEGASSLSTKLTDFEKGTEAVHAGAQDMHDGLSSLEEQIQPLLAQAPEEMRGELQAAFDDLLAGSELVTGGTSELQVNAGALSEGAQTLATSAGELVTGQEEVQEGIAKLQEGGVALEEGAQTLLTGQTELTEGMVYFKDQLSAAKTGTNQLAGGSETLSSGIQELAEGSGAFVEGSTELASGAEEVVAGMGTLTTGIDSLADGSSELVDGSNELTEKLGDAADEASIRTTEKTSQMMANPIEVGQDGLNKVPNYGTGFAPYFLSLGLFVGALLLSIVYPMRKPAGEPKNGIQWYLSKSIILIGIGTIQALIACAILLGALGLEVQSVPLFLTFAIMTSITFITLIQFFVTAFDNPGRFVAILILILQLTTSAGTFPLELIPESLQALNPLFPMTYSVQGFKAVISSGDYAVMWQNAGVLLGFTALFVAGTIIYFVIQFRNRESTISETA